MSTNILTPFAPFALDNQTNIRGVGVLVNRGSGNIVFNSEYRHTLYERKSVAIQSNIFVDLGSWRTPGGRLSEFLNSENIQMYAGFGLRLIGKKIYGATLRLDYGFDLTNINEGGFVIGVGQYF